MKIIKLLLLGLLPLWGVSQSTITRCPEDLVPKYDKQKKLWGFSNLFGQWVIEPTYTKVTPFVEDKAVVQKGLSYGVIACDGQVIIPPAFQNMTSYRAGKIWVQKNKLWGVMDERGKVLLDFQYNEINPIAHSPLSWIKKTELWGLFDEEKGRILCTPQFPMATIMSPNASLVKVGDKFGVLNHVNCGYLIKPEITKVKKVAKNIIVFKQNGLWGLFNEYGILRLNPEFDTLYSKYPETVIGVKKGKHGLYDLSGKEVLPPIYEAFGELSEGLFSINRNGIYGFATRQGKIVVSPQYQWVDKFLQKLAVVKKDKVYGVIDYTNKAKLPLVYNNIYRFNEGQFAVKKKDSKYYIYGVNINRLSSMGYDSIYADTYTLVRVSNNRKISFLDINTGILPFSSEFDESEGYFQNVAKVKKGTFWGIIDNNGHTVVDIKYDSIVDGSWDSKKVWTSWLAGRCGAIDTTGKVILPTDYDAIHYSGNGIIKLKKNNLWGISKSNGLIIANFVYTTLGLGDVGAGIPEFPAIVTEKRKQGLLNDQGILVYTTTDSIFYLGSKIYAAKGKSFRLIDERGSPLSKTNYDEVTKAVGQYIGIRSNNKWGVMDTKGLEIIKPQYTQLMLSQRFFAVKNKDKWGTITTNGTVKAPFQYEKAVQVGDEIFLYIGDKKFSLDTFGNIE